MIFIKVKKTITIDEQLWLKGTTELPITMNEFIEYCLIWYLGTDTKSGRLLKKAVELQDELNIIVGKLSKEYDKKKNVDNVTEYQKAMETVYRIHNKLGYIGRNQLEKIGNQNNFNVIDWMSYVGQQEDIIITNYGALPKF